MHGTDATVLLKTHFPTGPYAWRKKKNRFQFEMYGNTFQHKSYTWILWLEKCFNRVIQSRFRGSGEQMVRVGAKVFRVDGAMGQGKNMFVFEFLECGASHGTCPDCAKLKPRTNRQQFLFDETMTRISMIANSSKIFSIRYIWECEWAKLEKTNPDIRKFFKELAPTFGGRKSYHSEKSILADIVNGSLLG